ncbi:4Fe-4S binding protein [Candidatus Woesearchaeota archaeon]|nr:4Fe-4S binding protein [Candidatus Woesearchaeota archaeon]
MKKESNVIMVILFIFLISASFFLYDLSISHLYVYILLILLLLGIFFVLEIKRIKQLECLYPFVFLLSLIYPLFKCYFKVPYFFCHSCPRKCSFGILRPYSIPAFVTMNLNNRHWCFNYCPFGKLQDEQSKLCRKRLRVPRFFLVLPIIILIFITLFYFLIKKESINDFFFQYSYKTSTVVAVISLIIFLLAFIIPRIFCNYLCPVGLIGKITMKLEKKWLN